MPTNTSNNSTAASGQRYKHILNQQLGNDLSSRLSQRDIDTIYAAEYGQVTEQDRYDWILLYCGLHQDMLKIQQEVRTTMLAGAHPNAAAPYFFGRFLKVMEGRVAVLGRGGPIVVEGHAPRMPGRFMAQWAAGIVAGEPSLYHRIEASLAMQINTNGAMHSTASNSR